jgi:hypothetical protein
LGPERQREQRKKSRNTPRAVRIKCQSGFSQSSKNLMNVKDRTPENTHDHYFLRLHRLSAHHTPVVPSPFRSTWPTYALNGGALEYEKLSPSSKRRGNCMTAARFRMWV